MTKLQIATFAVEDLAPAGLESLAFTVSSDLRRDRGLAAQSAPVSSRQRQGVRPTLKIVPDHGSMTTR